MIRKHIHAGALQSVIYWFYCGKLTFLTTLIQSNVCVSLQHRRKDSRFCLVMQRNAPWEERWVPSALCRINLKTEILQWKQRNKSFLSTHENGSSVLRPHYNDQRRQKRLNAPLSMRISRHWARQLLLTPATFERCDQGVRS